MVVTNTATAIANFIIPGINLSPTVSPKINKANPEQINIQTKALKPQFSAGNTITRKNFFIFSISFFLIPPDIGSLIRRKI